MDMQSIAELVFGLGNEKVILAWWMIIIAMIVSLAVSLAMQPKVKPPKAAALEDFEMPVAEDGKDVSVVFGDCWVKDPNVLWYGDLSTRPIKGKSK